MADELKRNNGFIPGVKPGQPTTDYIGTIMDRITLPGAILLAVDGYPAGYLPAGIRMQQSFSTFFGGTTADHGSRNPGYAAADRKHSCWCASTMAWWAAEDPGSQPAAVGRI